MSKKRKVLYEPGNLVRYRGEIYVLGQSEYALTGAIVQYGLWSVPDWINGEKAILLLNNNAEEWSEFVISVKDVEMLDFVLQKKEIMFKFKVSYLINYGVMSIHVHEYRCRAWTKIGAWRKFLKDTAGGYHYADRSVLNNFWRMREDIKLDYKKKGE